MITRLGRKPVNDTSFIRFNYW